MTTDDRAATTGIKNFKARTGRLVIPYVHVHARLVIPITVKTTSIWTIVRKIFLIKICVYACRVFIYSYRICLFVYSY